MEWRQRGPAPRGSAVVDGLGYADEAPLRESVGDVWAVRFEEGGGHVVVEEERIFRCRLCDGFGRLEGADALVAEVRGEPRRRPVECVSCDGRGALRYAAVVEREPIDETGRRVLGAKSLPDALFLHLADSEARGAPIERVAIPFERGAELHWARTIRQALKPKFAEVAIGLLPAIAPDRRVAIDASVERVALRYEARRKVWTYEGQEWSSESPVFFGRGIFRWLFG